MLSERHPDGSMLGDLMMAALSREFQNIHNGDRFFYKTFCQVIEWLHMCSERKGSFGELGIEIFAKLTFCSLISFSFDDIHLLLMRALMMIIGFLSCSQKDILVGLCLEI